MNNKNIPNCMICKWRRKAIFTFASEMFCDDQGSKSCSEVYNRRRCKQLFEKKEEATLLYGRQVRMEGIGK